MQNGLVTITNKVTGQKLTLPKAQADAMVGGQGPGRADLGNLPKAQPQQDFLHTVSGALPAILGTVGGIAGSFLDPVIGPAGTIGGSAIGSGLGELANEGVNGQSPDWQNVLKQTLIGGAFGAIPGGEEALGVGKTAQDIAGQDLLGNVAKSGADTIAVDSAGTAAKGADIAGLAKPTTSDYIQSIGGNFAKRGAVGAGAGAAASGINDIGTGKSSDQVLGDMLQGGLATGLINGSVGPLIGGLLNKIGEGAGSLGEKMQNNFRVAEPEGVFNEASSVLKPEMQDQFKAGNEAKANDLVNQINAETEKTKSGYQNQIDKNNELIDKISKGEGTVAEKQQKIQDVIRQGKIDMAGQGNQDIAEEYGLFKKQGQDVLDPQYAYQKTDQSIKENQYYVADNLEGTKLDNPMKLRDLKDLRDKVYEELDTHSTTVQKGYTREEKDFRDAIQKALGVRNRDSDIKLLQNGLTGDQLDAAKNIIGKYWNSKDIVGEQAKELYNSIKNAEEEISKNPGETAKLNADTMKLYDIRKSLAKKLGPGGAGYKNTDYQVNQLKSDVSSLQKEMEGKRQAIKMENGTLKGHISKVMELRNQRIATAMKLTEKEPDGAQINTEIGKAIGEAKSKATRGDFSGLEDLNNKLKDSKLISDKGYSDVQLLLNQIRRGTKANVHPMVHVALSFIPILGYASKLKFIGYIWGNTVEHAIEKGALTPERYNKLITGLGKGVSGAANSNTASMIPDLISGIATRQGVAGGQNQPNPLLNSLGQ